MITKIPKLSVDCKNNIKAFVSEERLERAELFRDDFRKNRFLSAEIIASNFALQILKIPYTKFLGKVGKKPYLMNYKYVSCSRSYAEEFLVLAIDDKYSIGVDCEKIREVDESIMKYFFTLEESKYIEDCENPNLAFSLIWSRKESYIKSMGYGLDFPIKSINVVPKDKLKSRNTVFPIFNDNTKVGKSYINSYLFKDIVISICSEENSIFPELIIC